MTRRLRLLGWVVVTGLSVLFVVLYLHNFGDRIADLEGDLRVVVEGGRLRPRSERLVVGRRTVSRPVDTVLKQAAAVRDVVGADVPVHPVLCVAGDGPLEQGVIDVCDVLDVSHLMPCVSPHPIDHVESNIGIRMPDMCCVIRGNSAHVHRRVWRRSSRADDTGRGIEKGEWFSLSAQSARHRCRP